MKSGIVYGGRSAVKRFSFLTVDMLNTKDDIKLNKQTLLWNIETNRDYIHIVSPVIFMGKTLAFQ